MKMRFVAALAVAAMALPAAANAALVYDSSIATSGQGFGSAPRLLTIQGGGSGCVTVGGSGSTLVGGKNACDGTLYNNLGGHEANPLTDNQKFGIPTVGALGWASAADIGLLFNAVEPGSASKSGINVDDVTLKFYKGTTLIAQVNGAYKFGTTDQGNGSAGFVFTADQASQTYLNQAIFGLKNYGDVRIALESTLSKADGGPDSWAAVNLLRTPPVVSPVPEPATWAMMIAGFGLIGSAIRRRRGKLALA
jgi:hypothetical protein